MNEHRVLPEETRHFVLEELRGVAESLPCEGDCEQLMGGICAQPGLPADLPADSCPLRGFT